MKNLLLLLALFTSVVESKITADDCLVQGLEEIEPAFATFQGKMYAGLISIDEKDIENNEAGKLMFWLYEPDHPTVPDAIVFWFNGGPGCSSFHAGMFLEMGPVTTPLQPAGSFGQQKDAPYVENPYAWTNAAAVVYVEQPVNVGFSYGPNPPNDEEDVGRDFYHFLTHFNEIFPHLSERRLFMYGESYAGMYLPGMAHYIHKMNKDSSNKHVNLHGIALGNGWAAVLQQGGMVIDYAWWHGMIDSVTRDALNLEWQHCLKRSKWEPKPFHTFTTPDECGVVSAVLRASGGSLLDSRSTNMYDVTTFDTYKVLNDIGNHNEQFFNNPEVRKKLHVPPEIDKQWSGCIPGAGRRRKRRLDEQDGEDHGPLPGQVLLDDDKPITMVPYLAELLDDAHIRVVVYNGDRDMSTCAQGSEIMLNSMDWSGSADWLKLGKYSRALWMVDDYPAGWVKTVKNLDFVVVYNSGHLAPYNVPVQALDLVTRFVSDQKYNDVEIPVVFYPSVLEDQKSLVVKTWHHMKHFLPAMIGFVLGAACVLVYMKWKGNQQEYSYEAVGNVNDAKT